MLLAECLTSSEFGERYVLQGGHVIREGCVLQGGHMWLEGDVCPSIVTCSIAN